MYDVTGHFKFKDVIKWKYMVHKSLYDKMKKIPTFSSLMESGHPTQR